MTRPLALMIAAALSLGACAAEPAAPAAAKPGAKPAVAKAAPASEAAVRAALDKIAPGVVIDRVRPSAIAGYSEVATGGRVVYVSNDGRYLLQGALIDLSTRSNLTDRAVGELRKVELDKIGADRRIVFAPKDVKHRVTVFTDIDCGYCQKLHTHVAEFNKLGIAVEYLFFPRAGLGSESFDKAVTVWCAADRGAAMTAMKNHASRAVDAQRRGATPPPPPFPAKKCANPVAMDYELGQKVGVDGTPAIYAADGSHLGGYVEPADLLARLEAVAKRDAVATR